MSTIKIQNPNIQDNLVKDYSECQNKQSAAQSDRQIDNIAVTVSSSSESIESEKQLQMKSSRSLLSQGKSVKLSPMTDRQNQLILPSQQILTNSSLESCKSDPSQALLIPAKGSSLAAGQSGSPVLRQAESQSSRSAVSAGVSISSGAANTNTYQSSSKSSTASTNTKNPRFVKKANAYQTIDPVQRFFESDLNLKFAQDSSKFIGKIANTDASYTIERAFLQTDEIGIKLYHTHFQPSSQQPKSQIIVVHGFCEHSGLYMNFGDYFVRQGHSVHLYDQRGFGYSSGVSRNSSTEEFQQDFSLMLRQMDINVPVYVYAHSTGSLAALTYFMLNPTVTIAGFISLNVFTRIPQYFGLTNNKKWLLRFLLLFYQDLIVNSKINLSALCKNSYHIKKIIKDEHISPHLTLRMANSILEQCEFIQKNAHKITMPILLLHGKEDVVTKYQNSLSLFRAVSSTEKECKIIDDGFHQPHLDSSAPSLHALMNAWLERRTNSPNQKLIDSRQFDSVTFGCRMISLDSIDLMKIGGTILVLILFLQRANIKNFISNSQIFTTLLAFIKQITAIQQ